MSDNDDALANTALALNEDAKAERKRKARTPKPTAELPERQNFTLDDIDAKALRVAIAADNGDAESDVEPLWASLAAKLGFKVDTLVLISLPDEGPIEFSAEPSEAGPAIAAGESDPEVKADAEEFKYRDDEAESNAGLDKMEETSIHSSLASATLVGDIALALLEIIKHVQKPWNAHTQPQKRDLATRVTDIAQTISRRAVDIVAADERVTVKATLEKINITDKVQITLTLGAMSDDDKAEAISQLFHAQKKSVMIVTADSDRHNGRRRELVEPDEEELPFDAGNDKPKTEAAQAVPAAPADGSDSDLGPIGEDLDENEEDEQPE